MQPSPEGLTLTVEWSASGILIATLIGPASLEPALARFKEMFNLAAERKIRKILVNELAVTGILSTSERYRLATGAVAHLRSLQGFNPAVAVVGVPVVGGFGVQVAQNLGALVLLFSQVEKATNWLGTVQLEGRANF